MVSGFKFFSQGNITNIGFEFDIFFKRDNFAAVQASQVMVVVNKSITQLQLIFPANMQAVNDTELFKERNYPIHTGSVGSYADAVNKFCHGLCLMSRQGFKYGSASRAE